MIRIAAALSAALALSACTTTGGVPANGGAALTSAQSVFVGTWPGKLPSGKPVRVTVSPEGRVSYDYMGRSQRVSDVSLTATQLSFTVGTNGSTVVMTPSGAYKFTWGPTGEVTRASLRKS